MLEAFASVGGELFNLTWTNLQAEKTQFRRSVPLAELRRELPGLLDSSTRAQHNLILRPFARNSIFIQLDDLPLSNTNRLRPITFLQLETSPGNYQAWVAVEGPKDDDFARRLRKGTGADATASGATRVAGSLNFKEKYAPNFPRVRIHACTHGLLVSKEQLTALDLVAEPERPRPKPFRVSPEQRSGRRSWPSYARCLQGAPPNHGGTGRDISRADFTWCMLAIDWGWGIEETAARLMEESSKARENGEIYAQLTAQNAAVAVQRNRSR